MISNQRPYRVILAGNQRQARDFMREQGWNPRECIIGEWPSQTLGGSDLAARVDHLEALLAEVLEHFTQRGHPGHPSLRTPWIAVEKVAEWRQRASMLPANEGSKTALDSSAPAGADTPDEGLDRSPISPERNDP